MIKWIRRMFESHVRQHADRIVSTDLRWKIREVAELQDEVRGLATQRAELLRTNNLLLAQVHTYQEILEKANATETE